MTVGAWIGFLIIVILAIVIGGVFCAETDNSTAKTVCIIICVMCVIGTLFGLIWYYRNTESGKRAMKSQESNFSNGIYREVNVYDMQGDVIKTYKGRFDVDYDSDRVIFDDENGKRHIIYYPTGTVIVDEIDNN